MINIYESVFTFRDNCLFFRVLFIYDLEFQHLNMIFPPWYLCINMSLFLSVVRINVFFNLRVKNIVYSTVQHKIKRRKKVKFGLSSENSLSSPQLQSLSTIDACEWSVRCRGVLEKFKQCYIKWIIFVRTEKCLRRC